MAETEFPLGDALAVQRWSTSLAVEADVQQYFAKFMTTGDDNVIKIKTELEKQAGEKITYALRMKMTGDGIEGDNTIEGTSAEEALTFYSDYIFIDQRRKGTKSKGQMSEQRVPYNMREEGRNALASWHAEDYDQLMFIYLSGARGVDTSFHVPVGFTGRANNTVTAPDSDHIVYGGSATSKATVTSSDGMRVDMCERLVAKGFLRQIKNEFEQNRDLKAAFPDILYPDPRNQSPKWSEDDGILVKRQTTPRESSVEAWGIVDGQPIGKHFGLMVMDDVVTPESVGTSEMIKKTNTAWELSMNLTSRGGVVRMIGTRYHYNDTYEHIRTKDIVKFREYPCTKDGTIDGEPVFLTREQIALKRKTMGSHVFSSQMLLAPRAEEAQGFDAKWLRFWTPNPLANLHVGICVDPANEKSKKSDYTVMIVAGKGIDGHLYVLDIVRDKMNLGERTKMLIDLHMMYKPKVVGYEKYGKDSDIQHIQSVQQSIPYSFDIVALGGKRAKNDRIRDLVPKFESGEIHLPERLIKKDYTNESINIIHAFINEEFNPFPYGKHDDILDCLARFYHKDFMLSQPVASGNVIAIDRSKRIGGARKVISRHGARR